MFADYSKKNTNIVQTMEMTVQLIKWFNNHSYTLRVFNKEQESSPLGKTLALIASVVTY